MAIGKLSGTLYDLKNPEQLKAYNSEYAKWYRAIPEKREIVYSAVKRWMERNPEKYRQCVAKSHANMSEEQKEKKREYARTLKWYKYNFDDEYKEAQKAKCKQYYADNREKCLAYSKQYYYDHPEKRERLKQYSKNHRENGAESVFFM